MPPRADKAAAKKRAARDNDTLSLRDLVARCTRADLEALLLQHEDDLHDLRAEVEARLKPEQVRARGNAHAHRRALSPRTRGGLQWCSARARRPCASARRPASGAACGLEPGRAAAERTRVPPGGAEKERGL